MVDSERVVLEDFLERCAVGLKEKFRVYTMHGSSGKP